MEMQISTTIFKLNQSRHISALTFLFLPFSSLSPVADFAQQKQNDLLGSRRTNTSRWKTTISRATVGIYTHPETTIAHSAGNNYY